MKNENKKLLLKEIAKYVDSIASISEIKSKFHLSIESEVMQNDKTLTSDELYDMNFESTYIFNSLIEAYEFLKSINKPSNIVLNF